MAHAPAEPLPGSSPVADEESFLCRSRCNLKRDMTGRCLIQLEHISNYGWQKLLCSDAYPHLWPSSSLTRKSTYASPCQATATQLLSNKRKYFGLHALATTCYQTRRHISVVGVSMLNPYFTRVLRQCKSAIKMKYPMWLF
eukprot:scaffold563945_cov36-Prasinocladus_malaysianus.AAC.1